MKRAWCLLALAGLGLAAAACGGEGGKPSSPAVTAAPAETTPPATASPPSPGSAEREILSVLTVERQVDVLAEREGVAVEISHDEGDRVAAGAVLARLDDRELQAELDRARADLEIARTNVKYNEAELKARQAAHRRAQEMRELGLNSDADLEEAEFRAKASQYDLESWQTMVKRREAEIRLLELDLEKSRIRAPFGGVVARRYIRPGQNVGKSDPCFLLSQMAPLQVRFLVSETAVPPRPGATVNVSPVSDRQRVYPARVLRVSPTVDAASGSYDVTAQLGGDDLGELRPGMSVRVSWGVQEPDR